MSNDNNLLKPFKIPSPMDYWQEKAGEFFKSKQQPAEEIKVNQEETPMNMKDLYAKHNIKQLLFFANGKFTAHLNNGITVNGQVNYGQTEIAPNTFQTLESDKCAAIDEFLDRHAYTIQANAASYQTAKAAFNRNQLVVNERVAVLKEMGVAKLEQQHLPRLGKMFVKATMSDGSIVPFYSPVEMHKEAGTYEDEFVMYLKAKPEAWTEPVSDDKALSTNALRELNKVPSSILNLK